MRLAHKFLFIIVVVIAGFGMVTYTVHAIMNNEKNLKLLNHETNNFNEVVTEIASSVQIARRNEKDFLLGNNLLYMENNEKLVTKVGEMLGQLHDMLPDDNSQTIVNQLHETMEGYLSAFKTMVETRKKMGLDHNSGLHGKLRKAVHNAEKMLDNYNQITLSHSMLMMRRHEKDYMARELNKYVEKMAAEQKRFDSLLEKTDLPPSDKAAIRKNMGIYHQIFQMLPPLYRDIEESIRSLNDAVIKTDTALMKLIEIRDKKVADAHEFASATAARLASHFYLITAGIIAAVVLLLVLVARIVTRSIQTASRIADSVAAGNLENVIEVKSNDETGELLRSLQAMQTNLKESIESVREVAASSNRAMQALDNSSSNIMLSDMDSKVMYANKSMRIFIQDAINDFHTVIPELDVNNIEGTSIESFFQKPGQHHCMLADLTETRTFTLHPGERHLQVTTSPVVNDEGTRIGVVLEWRDRTQEVAIEEEIKNIVVASLSGDLSRRIDMTGKNGFFEMLSHGINDLVDVSERVINDTAQVINAIARGDLTRSVDAEYEGSFDELKQDINTTIGKLTSIMGEITNRASTVMSASRRITEGNINLSQRTEEQSNSLEETTTSMKEMTSTVRQNADNALQANQLASGTRTQAEQGGQIVNDAINAMSEITDSSKKIADIIGVIDEIAFQTNLLALNAAVEAARAGEQGRGFAVVASEVRNLAGRSAIAAREIKNLIEDSVTKVMEGTKLVNKSGETLEAITSSVEKVSNLIAEIATASQQQSTGIEQVNTSIADIDEITRQNAELVEQAAASSEAMSVQARNLNELVGFFSLGVAQSNDEIAVEQHSATRPWSETGRNRYSTGRRTGTDDE